MTSNMGSAATKTDVVMLNALLDKVYKDSGYDFREYKRGTVMRRLARRLHATGARTYPNYMKFLDTHSEEYHKFADDLTIKTSGFFRSPYTSQQIARLVLPELVSSKTRHGGWSLKFWSTACARGEEPYSMAILLTEVLRHRLRDFDISIYATDISREAMKKAEAGVYSPQETEGVSIPIRERYFIPYNGNYSVNNDIRQMVTFSYFDLTSTIHPPLANLDCVLCCNVLIYLQEQLQERVLNMLYDSLATPGYLILGEVETPPNSLRSKLECLDIKARIYKKNVNQLNQTGYLTGDKILAERKETKE